MVESTGPPPVMTMGCTIRRNAPMSMVMRTNEKVGRMLGMVMKKNFCTGFAPSIAAAS